MKAYLHTLVIVSALAFACGIENVLADELVLSNGERLIGRLADLQDGTAVFESEMLGSLKIPAHRIERITVDTPRETHLADGSVLSVSSIAIADGTARLELPGEPSARIVEFHHITAISPPPRPRLAVSGGITAGAVDTHGSKSSTKSNLDANITIRTTRQRLYMDGRWFYGREKRRSGGTASRYVETDKNYRVSAKYDYFLTDTLYAYLSTNYKRDSIADLNYRLINSTGLGYQWVETTRLKFSTDTGIAYYQEKYSARVGNPLYGSDPDQKRYLRKTTRVDDVAWQTGMSLEWRINSRLSLLSKTGYTQSFADSSDYFLNTDGDLRIFITNAFYCNFKGILEYDNTPGRDSKSTETKYILGLGWGF